MDKIDEKDLEKVSGGFKFKNCEFENNDKPQNGGGIYIKKGEFIMPEDSEGK